MIIDNLNTLPTPVQSTDEIPVERGTSTYKTTVANILSIHDSGSVTVIPASGVTVSVSGAKSADIKYLRFTISNTSLTSSKEICTIPSEWCPVAARPYFPALDDINGSVIGIFILNPNGKLFYYGQTTNDTIICCGLYM